MVLEWNGKVGGPISQNFAESTKSFEPISLLTKVGIPKVARIEDVYEAFCDFKSLGISTWAQNEDVYEGFTHFWSILEFLGTTRGPKPTREYIPGYR